MIKFMLIMQICSAVHMNCMDEKPIGVYSSHYDCVTAGYINAIGTTQNIGPEEVEKNKIVIKFSCSPLRTT